MGVTGHLTLRFCGCRWYVSRLCFHTSVREVMSFWIVVFWWYESFGFNTGSVIAFLGVYCDIVFFANSFLLFGPICFCGWRWGVFLRLVRQVNAFDSYVSVLLPCQPSLLMKPQTRCKDARFLLYSSTFSNQLRLLFLVLVLWRWNQLFMGSTDVSFRRKKVESGAKVQVFGQSIVIGSINNLFSRFMVLDSGLLDRLMIWHYRFYHLRMGASSMVYIKFLTRVLLASSRLCWWVVSKLQDANLVFLICSKCVSYSG